MTASNIGWVVYRKNGELYSMWTTWEHVGTLTDILYWKDVADDYWWSKVKESRKKHTR